MTMTNAGPPPTPEEIAAELETQRQALPQWAYRVDRHPAYTRTDGPTMLSWGTRVQLDGQTMADAAARIGGETRGLHPQYTGPLHVWVWEARPNEHYTNPPPADQEPWTFEPGTPPIPPPEPCQHGQLDYCETCGE